MNVNHPIAAHRLRNLAREALFAEAVSARLAAAFAERPRPGLGFRNRLGGLVIALGRWVAGIEAADGGRATSADAATSAPVSFGPSR